MPDFEEMYYKMVRTGKKCSGGLIYAVDFLSVF